MCKLELEDYWFIISMSLILGGMTMLGIYGVTLL